MQQLTRKQAERCSRACEWIYCDTTGHGNPIIPYWHVPPQERRHLFAKDIPLDPYFWFPRLWERYRDGGYAVNVARSLVILLCATGSKELSEVCLWLCAAIEALEKERR